MRHLYLTALPDRVLFTALDDELLPERTYLSYRDGRFRFSTEESEISRSVDDDSILQAKERLERELRDVMNRRPRIIRAEKREDLPRGEAVEVYGSCEGEEVFAGRFELGEEVYIAARGTDTETARTVTETSERVLTELLTRAVELYYSS